MDYCFVLAGMVLQLEIDLNSRDMRVRVCVSVCVCARGSTWVCAHVCVYVCVYMCLYNCQHKYEGFVNSEEKKLNDLSGIY